MQVIKGGIRGDFNRLLLGNHKITDMNSKKEMNYVKEFGTTGRGNNTTLFAQVNCMNRRFIIQTLGMSLVMIMIHDSNQVLPYLRNI